MDEGRIISTVIDKLLLEESFKRPVEKFLVSEIFEV
jgi:hypothetical protein